jgi:hypothetical protein
MLQETGTRKLQHGPRGGLQCRSRDCNTGWSADALQHGPQHGLHRLHRDQRNEVRHHEPQHEQQRGLRCWCTGPPSSAEVCDVAPGAEVHIILHAVQTFSAHVGMDVHNFTCQDNFGVDVDVTFFFGLKSNTNNSILLLVPHSLTFKLEHGMTVTAMI